MSENLQCHRANPPEFQEPEVPGTMIPKPDEHFLQCSLQPRRFLVPSL